MADSPKPDNIVPMVLGLSLLAVVLWVVFGSSIRESTWSAMRAQAVVMQHVIPLYPESYQRDFKRFVRILQRPVPADLPAGTLFEAVSMSGKFLALPAMFGLVLMALWVWRRAPAVRFRRRLDFEGLLRHNAKVFPPGSGRCCGSKARRSAKSAAISGGLCPRTSGQCLSKP
jgi:flagellar biosynthesis regulator FlaF